MKEDRALNVAIVGGESGCKGIMDLILAAKFKKLRMNLIGVADVSSDTVAQRYAQEQGIYTTQDYRDLYKLKNLDMIINMTGRDEVANEISQTKPDHVQVMDHVTARLFWDVFHAEEERTAERERAEEALREDRRFLQDVFEAIQDGMTILDCEFNIVRANPWMEKMYAPQMPLVGKKCYRAYQKRESPCPDCPARRTLATGEAHSEMVPYPSAENPTRWIAVSYTHLRAHET